MKAPCGLDRAYKRRIADQRFEALTLRIFGGKEGLAAASAYLKAQRAIRFAQGKATKVDRVMARIGRG